MTGKSLVTDRVRVERSTLFPSLGRRSTSRTPWGSGGSTDPSDHTARTRPGKTQNLLSSTGGREGTGTVCTGTGTVCTPIPLSRRSLVSEPSGSGSSRGTSLSFALEVGEEVRGHEQTRVVKTHRLIYLLSSPRLLGFGYFRFSVKVKSITVSMCRSET